MSVTIELALKGIKDIQDQLGSLSDSFDKEMKKTQDAVKTTSTGMGNLSSAIKLAAAAIGLWKLGDIIKESSMLSARVETLGIVLNTIGTTAGYSTKELNSFVSGVKAMGITTQESMQSLTKMVQSNLDLSKATQLARVAQDAAVIANTNSSDAMGRLLHGITTLQPEILRNLGIVVNSEQAYRNFAAATNRTTESLSQHEKQQIMMTAVLKEGEKIAGSYENAMNTVGKQLTSLPRYVEELKLKFGDLFKPALGVAVGEFTQLLKYLSEVITGMKESGDLLSWARAIGNAFYLVEYVVLEMTQKIQHMGEVATTILSLVTFGSWKKKLEEVAASFKAGGASIEVSLEALAKRANNFNDELDKGIKTLQRTDIQKVLDSLAMNLRKNTEKAVELGKAFNKTEEDIKVYEEALIQLKKLGLESTAVAIVNVKDKLKELKTTPEMANITKVLTELAKTLDLNAKQAAVFGSAFKKTEADTKAYHGAIDKLLETGLKPTNKTIQDLKIKMDSLNTTNTKSNSILFDMTNAVNKFGLNSTSAVDNNIPKFSLLKGRLEDTKFSIDNGASAFTNLGVVTVGSLETVVKKTDEVVTVQSMMEVAVRGVTTAIKGLWEGATVTFESAWKGALTVFVDVLGQMVVQMGLKAAIMQAHWAAMTAGISLVIGLIASVFGGGGGGVSKKSAIQEATEKFLEDIRRSLTSFEDQVLTTLEKLKKATGTASTSTTGITSGFGAFDILRKKLSDLNMEYAKIKLQIYSMANQGQDYQYSIDPLGLNRVYVDIAKVKLEIDKLIPSLLTQMTTLKDALIQEYNLKKKIAEDTIAIYQKQLSFVKGMDETITGVKRALLSPQEAFTAQLGDITALQKMLAGTTGESRLGVIDELKAAYLQTWQSAQGLFKEDTTELVKWQKFTIAGLEGLKVEGITAYDQLINVNLQMLSIQRSGVDIQTQMLAHISKLGTVTLATIALMEQIAAKGVTNITDADITALTKNLGVLGLASGGIVTKPTLAVIGEGGESEAVIPLSKLGNMKNKTVSIVNQFMGPVVWDSISASQFARKQAQLIYQEQRRYV